MTIYDISEKAGVSIATVSRVLNGSNNVSEKTKKKVLDVIGDEELELLRELKLIRERKEKLKKIIEAGE